MHMYSKLGKKKPRLFLAQGAISRVIQLFSTFILATHYFMCYFNPRGAYILRYFSWLRWHCPPDTGFEIRALAVWGRARYLTVTEAPHNTNFHTWMGKKHFCFFQTAETGNRTSNSGLKSSGANHYPRAPALLCLEDSVISIISPSSGGSPGPD